MRIETAPGRQLQSDWGAHRTRIAGDEMTVHFVVSTLGFSWGVAFLVHGLRGPSTRMKD